MLVYELLVYVWHRTMHRLHWLWRSFHQMHHSAERMDSYGAFYFSPLDIVGFTFLTSLSADRGRGTQRPGRHVLPLCHDVPRPSSSTRTSARRSGWATSCSGPRATASITGAAFTSYNYSDLPLFDILFGTFRNPRDFVSESGFEGVSSAQILDMLACRDVAAADFEQSVRPTKPRAAHT